MGTLPAYLLPTADPEFPDVPNGLPSILKMPTAGFGLILTHTSFCETS